ncbi:Hypothetical protein SMAX5B_000111 [Scophthalmus maximus]|uniref:Uncharacterized protein n=1 Tax=Scophthalmus maximus TaxID=52904 RepID=A0A2U9CUE4_SCOMX|nr:Hypothetical protein SMAX5B_000111 [Scophthalmus maximus]
MPRDMIDAHASPATSLPEKCYHGYYRLTAAFSLRRTQPRELEVRAVGQKRLVKEGGREENVRAVTLGDQVRR